MATDTISTCKSSCTTCVLQITKNKTTHRYCSKKRGLAEACDEVVWHVEDFQVLAQSSQSGINPLNAFLLQH